MGSLVADRSLITDRDKLLLMMISSGADALQYASEELRADHECISKACSMSIDALKCVLDRTYVIALVTEDGRKLQYASSAMRKDKDVVLAAVRSRGGAIQYADFSLQMDRDVVLAAVNQQG